MPKVKLYVTFCTSARSRPDRKRHDKLASPGFGIECRPDGSKTYFYSPLRDA